MYLTKNKYIKMRDNHRNYINKLQLINKSALKIQLLYRNHRAIIFCNKLRIQKNRHELIRLRNICAIIIQKNVKMLLAKRKIEKIKSH